MARQAEPGVSRRLALGLVGLLVVGAIVGLVLIITGGDDGDGGDASAPTTTSTTAAPLSDDAKDLVARLESGRDEPVHVRLATAEGAPNGTVVVEIWRDGDRVRQDVLVDNAGSHTEVAAFQLDDGNVICQRQSADAEWACQRAVSTAASGDPVGLIEAVAANLADAAVTATDDSINDEPVRCYAIARADGTSTLCLSDAGVPMRLSTLGQDLTATAVDHDVAADVFTPPAEVAES